MSYRIQIRTGKRWSTVGLDCLDLTEARTAVAALVPHGVAYRVLMIASMQQ